MCNLSNRSKSCISIGVLNQLFITIGILGTQSIGLPLAKMSLWHWRFVLVVSAVLAVVQCLTVVFISETPTWLTAKGRHTQAIEASRRLWGCCYTGINSSSAPSTPRRSRNSSRTRGKRDGDSSRTLTEDSEQQGLLSDEDDEDGAPVQSSVRPAVTSVVDPTEPITILELIKRKELRRPVAIVALAMISQQGSGINAGMLLRFPPILSPV